jgi:uncharacterized protein (DUF58 family)
VVLRPSRDLLPISIDELEAFRLEALHVGSRAGGGAHYRRRQGQSLEFREFRDYQYGDDIRMVDWRASARSGGQTDWIVRLFEAEDHLTVAVSIDPRPSMYLPDDGLAAHDLFFATSKMQVACWLAQALGEIVDLDRDSLLMHRLFNPVGNAPAPIERGGAETARRFCRSLREEVPSRPADWDRRYTLDADGLLAALPPASVLVVLSDLYFEEELDAFVDLLIEAQTSYRQVVLVHLDCWPTERARLLRGVTLLEGVEGVIFDGSLTESDEAFLAEGGKRIDKHVESVVERAQAGGLVFGSWSWPDDDAEAAERLRRGFAAQFSGFTPFKSIFMKPG